MSSADSNLVAAMLATLGCTATGKAGMVRIEASNPEGSQGIRFLAIDEVAYLQHVEPALREAKVEVVEVKRGKR